MNFNKGKYSIEVDEITSSDLSIGVKIGEGEIKMFNNLITEGVLFDILNDNTQVKLYFYTKDSTISSSNSSSGTFKNLRLYKYE